MTVSITINDKPIHTQEGKTVLEVAMEHGFNIPHLCYHKDLSPVGSCRLCLVEVEGWRGQVASCTLTVSEGMAIKSNSPSLTASRKSILELLLQNYFDSGYTSEDEYESEFLRWARLYNATLPEGFEPRRRFTFDQDSNPFVLVDFNKCILCTRCVRACAEIQGRYVWGVAQRGHEARIVAGADTTMLEARCESCGACVAYCPTGALDNRLSYNLGVSDRLVTTTCTYCGVGCQFDLNVKNGKVIRVTSNPLAPVNGMSLCVKGRYGYDFIHHPDRLVKPRVRKYLLDARRTGVSTLDDRRKKGPDDWVEVDWDTALDITVDKLIDVRGKFGADSIGVLSSAKCLNEENYLMNKFARQVIGTNNIDHCARL